MAFHKGKPKTGGRKAGVSNKNTLAAKEAFQRAFDKIGGASALADWAKNNPSEFYKIYGRLIPMDTNITGGAITVTLAGRLDAAEKVANANR